MSETITNKVIIDTSQATESVADVTRQFLDMSTYAQQAAEGITHVGDEYQFANKNLQEWYDTLKKMQLAHNETTVQIVSDMQKAAAATKTAATAAGDYQKVITKGSQGVLGSLEHQKLAFEDIGRVALGEKFGLRQFGQLFGVIGPVAAIATFAIAEYGGEIAKLVSPLTEAGKAQQDLTESISKGAEKSAEATIDIEKQQALFANSTSISDRKKALDDYNKTFGDIIGYAKTFEEAEKNLVEKTEIYKAAMKQRAIADAAYALQKAKITEAIKAEAEGETGFVAKAKAAFSQLIGNYGDAANALVAGNKKIVGDLNDDADRLAKTADKAEKEFQRLKKLAGGGTGKPPKEDHKHDNSLEEQKRYVEESQKITENAEQKEITSEQIKYEKIKADLVANHHSTEALTEQHEQNIIDIHQRYADKLAEEFKKEQAKIKAEEDKDTAEFFKNEEKKAQEAEKAKQKELEADQKADAKFFNAEFERYQTELKMLKGHTDQKIAIINAEAIQAKGALDRKAINQEEYNKKIAELEKDELEIKKQVAVEEKAIVNAAASVLDDAAKLAGEHTAAGKDLAIASSTIKAIGAGIATFAGFVEDFPGPVGIALGAVAAAGVVVTLFEDIKKIEAVKIPGAGSSGSASVSTPSTPSAPSIPKNTPTTNLSAQSTNAIRTNQQQSAPVRAVVVESDITNSQARIASFHQGSTLH